MKRLFAGLSFCLGFCLLVITSSAQAQAQAQERQAEDYTLSMAGALINEHCGRVWQAGEYVNIHACNYELANQFTLAISTQHFTDCTVIAQGDIVKIADCMVARFNSWLEQQAQ